ncbi:MAG TPA: hypothetical protein VJ748_05175 [Vitreimonas sp.]|jgi:hypothetical protein|nr:hypothetical protein [Vitreimonas sp.]
MSEHDRAPEAQKAADPKKLKDDLKPGEPKRAHRDFVNSGKHENKDTREELRKKH